MSDMRFPVGALNVFSSPREQRCEAITKDAMKARHDFETNGVRAPPKMAAFMLGWTL